jgi:hypothetical protein
MSALPLRADMLSLGIYVCLVPEAEIALLHCTCFTAGDRQEPSSRHTGQCLSTSSGIARRPAGFHGAR